MLIIRLDFRQLTDRAAFYQQFACQSHCPSTFGNNLDALWDWLTAGMALPAELHLLHCEEHHGSITPVLALLEEAAQSLNGDLRLIKS